MKLDDYSASSKWRLLLSPPGDAFTNMALDEALVRTPNAPPTFRVYYWNSPSLSIGYFQKAVEVLNSLACRGTLQRAPTLVRRPTGGTAVLHDGQPSFSLVLRTHASPVSTRYGASVGQIYRLLGQAIIEALKALDMGARLWEEKDRNNSHFCTSNFSPYDVIYQGQKVAGYSARRLRGVTLFQGYLHLPKPVGECPLAEALVAGMEKAINARLREGSLTEPEALLTQELRQKKYLRRDWNYKR